jgi:hypothetical protein
MAKPEGAQPMSHGLIRSDLSVDPDLSSELSLIQLERLRRRSTGTFFINTLCTRCRCRSRPRLSSGATADADSKGKPEMRVERHRPAAAEVFLLQIRKEVP